MKTSVTYRPKGNLVWGFVAIVLDLMFLIQVLAYPTAGENYALDFLVAGVVAAVAVLIWLRPKLVLHSQHLVVVNPLKSTTIEYEAIESLDTKWALLIRHREKSTRVWVAPANGKYRWIAESNARIFFSKLPRTEGKVVDVTSMSQSANSDSGVAARLIRERIEDLHY